MPVGRMTSSGPEGCQGFWGLRGGRSLEILQFLAGLEPHRLSGRDRHLDPGLGIAADTLLAVAHLENTEAPELDALTLRERLLHRRDDRVDCECGLDSGDIGQLRHSIHDVCLDHAGSLRARSVTTAPGPVNA